MAASTTRLQRGANTRPRPRAPSRLVRRTGATTTPARTFARSARNRRLFERSDQERKAEQKHLPLEAVLGAELDLVASEESAKLGGGGDLGPHREDVRSDAAQRVRNIRAPVVGHLPLRVANHP